MRWQARVSGKPAWKRRWHRVGHKTCSAAPGAAPLPRDARGGRSVVASGKPAGLAGGSRRRGGAGATEANRPAHHDLAHQDAGAALLLDGHVELVARAGADGAHLGGIAALEEALPSLKPDRIAGVGGLATRHDSMAAGELGADYVLFGEPDANGQRPSREAIAERLRWWEELFEPPCVGFAVSREEAGEFAAAGADFVLVGDFIWADPRGAEAALTDVEQAIRQAHAAAIGKAKAAEQG